MTTDAVRQLAHDRSSSWEIRKAAREDGMRTLREDAWLKGARRHDDDRRSAAGDEGRSVVVELRIADFGLPIGNHESALRNPQFILMPDFAYIARDLTGKRVEGTLAAGTEREAIAALSGRNLFPLKVASADGRAAGAKSSPRVRPRIMAATYGQLSALLGSGVPLLRSLEVIREQTPHKNLAQVLEDVHSRVQEGSTLADAMARHPRAFGELAHEHRPRRRRRRLHGRSARPAREIHRTAGRAQEPRHRGPGLPDDPVRSWARSIVNVLIIFFVPKFESLFQRLRERGELPAVTDWLLALSDTHADVRYFRDLGTGHRGHDHPQRVCKRMKAACGSIACGSKCRSSVRHLSEPGRVAVLPRAGNAADGRRADCPLAGNQRRLHGQPRAVRRDPRGGREYFRRRVAGHAAGGERPLSADVVEMIAVAEQSNNLETVLPHIADSLERDTWRRLDLFVRLLEPLMLLILAGVVLVVVIALLLPVLKMSMTV